MTDLSVFDGATKWWCIVQSEWPTTPSLFAQCEL